MCCKEKCGQQWVCRQPHGASWQDMCPQPLWRHVWAIQTWLCSAVRLGTCSWACHSQTQGARAHQVGIGKVRQTRRGQRRVKSGRAWGGPVAQRGSIRFYVWTALAGCGKRESRVPVTGMTGKGHGVNIVWKWDASFIYVALASGWPSPSGSTQSALVLLESWVNSDSPESSRPSCLNFSSPGVNVHCCWKVIGRLETWIWTHIFSPPF